MPILFSSSSLVLGSLLWMSGPPVSSRLSALGGRGVPPFRFANEVRLLGSARSGVLPATESSALTTAALLCPIPLPPNGVLGSERVPSMATVHRRFRAATTLRRHVPHVLELVSEEKVLGPGASRGVATVQHVLGIGDWPEVKDIRDTMRSQQSAGVSARRDDAVALPVNSRSPQPALVAPVDLRPEAAHERVRHNDGHRRPARHETILIQEFI